MSFKVWSVLRSINVGFTSKKCKESDDVWTLTYLHNFESYKLKFLNVLGFNLLFLIMFIQIVRETSLLCLGAVVALPHARVFPLRKQVGTS